MSPPPFSLGDLLARLDATAARVAQERAEAAEAEAFLLGFEEGRRVALAIGRPRA